MANLIPLGKVAERAGINRDKARYWLGLLGESSVKSDGRLMVHEDSAAMLEAMRKTIAAGTSPAVAAQEVKGILSQSASPTIKKPDTTARLESFEKSIMLLVESHERGAAAIRAEVSRLVEENHFLRNEIANLGNRLACLQVSLLPPPPPLPQQTTPCVPRSPEIRLDTASEMPWWHRLWLEITAPEKLRRFA